MRQPSQLRAIQTRNAILDAGAREFSANGYAGATAKSIAAKAQAATGSFYQYFPNKDALLRELAALRQREIAEQTVARLESAPALADSPESLKSFMDLIRAGVRDVVEVVIAQHREDTAFHAVLTERRYADPELDALISAGEAELVERIEALLERWHHPGDRRASAFILFGLIEGSVHTHVLGTAVVDDPRFIDALVEAVIRVALPFTNGETHATD